MCCIPSSGLHVALELALTFTSRCSDMLKMHWLQTCFIFCLSLWKVRQKDGLVTLAPSCRVIRPFFVFVGFACHLVLVCFGSLAPTGTKSAFWRSTKKMTNMRTIAWVTKSKMKQRRQLLPNHLQLLRNGNRDQMDVTDVTDESQVCARADMLGFVAFFLLLKAGLALFWTPWFVPAYGFTRTATKRILRRRSASHPAVWDCWNMLKTFSFVSIRTQSKESDDESEEEMGFRGARYAAARHIVPECPRPCKRCTLTGSPLYPILSDSISLYPYPDGLNASECGLFRGRSDHARWSRPCQNLLDLCSSYMLGTVRLQKNDPRMSEV